LLVCNHQGYEALCEWEIGSSGGAPFYRPLLEEEQDKLRLRTAIDAVVANAYCLSREDFAHVLSTFSHKTYPQAPEFCLAMYDELQQLGFEAFARKHDPYFDTPLNESLSQPAIDLPIPASMAPAVDASKKKRKSKNEPSGPLLPFGDAATATKMVQDPTVANRVAQPHSAYTSTDHFAGIHRLLKDRGTITSSDAQAATGLDAPTVRLLLKRLVAEGHAKAEGQKRGTRYSLTDPDNIDRTQ